SLDKNFYIQKVWLEIGGLLLSLPVLLIIQELLEPQRNLFSGSWLQMAKKAFTGWMCAALVARVVQSWFTGIVSKYLSTLSRSVIQCIAVIVVHMWDPSGMQSVSLRTQELVRDAVSRSLIRLLQPPILLQITAFQAEARMLHVQRMSGEELASFPVGTFLRVSDLKTALQSNPELRGQRLKLVCDGVVLPDDHKLESAVALLLVVSRPFVEATESSVQKLVLAAEKGAVSEVEEMLQQPYDPDLRGFVRKSFAEASSHGYQTPLAAAAGSGQTEVVRLLLAAGAKVNLRSQNQGFWRKAARNPKVNPNATPLFQASCAGHAEVVRLLLDAQADQHQVCGVEALSPFHAAVKRGRTEVAGLLLEARADTNKAHGDETPLATAILQNHPDMVALLLKNGADKEQVVDFDTPLGLAVRRGRQEIVALLLEAGADRHRRFGPVRERPMAVAAKYGYTAIMRLLQPGPGSEDSPKKGIALEECTDVYSVQIPVTKQPERDGEHEVQSQSLPESDEEVSDESHEADDTAAFEEWSHAAFEEHIAGIVSSMDPAQPDIIQCVRASQALGCFGRAFRPAGRGKSRRSFPTNHIQEFWSHSWHGNAWHKVLTALYLYNGMTAAVFASLGTLLLWALVAWSYLPVEPLWWREHPAASFWCTGTSILLYCLALFFSKPRRRVFLDILCIDQEDTSLKAAGLVSMGAFLKCSDSMLVLWDPSYTHRLWCVFEMAAYLHSRPADKVKLIIRPTILGPVFISLPVALFFFMLVTSVIPTAQHAIMWPLMGLAVYVGFYKSCSMLREYWRSVELLEKRVAGFTAKESLCWCCSADHKDADGESIVCDRQIVFRCIVTWFGSLENFETRVRTDVLECLVDQLSKQIFTYKQCALAALPYCWSSFDVSAVEASLRIPDYDLLFQPFDFGGVMRPVCRGLGWALGFLPVIFFLASRLGFLLRHKRDSICAEVLVNSCILVAMIAVFFALLMLEQACWSFEGPLGYYNLAYHRLPGTGVFVGILLSTAAILFCCIGPRCCGRRSFKPASEQRTMSPEPDRGV
ncbi:ANK1, partial [Symbiodinium necroappetens]